jgi:uncharacterized protein YbcI
MDKSDSTTARQIARAAVAFERERAGHPPQSVAVVLGGETVVVTLHGALSPAEKALAKSPEGAARLREFHRQLFAACSGPLREQIRRITAAEVREATAEVEPTTDTMVQVFLLAHGIPADAWSGAEPDRQA